MEEMGVEYQRFDGREYVSLKRYNNLLCKCKDLEEENKNLRDYADNLDSENDNQAIEIEELKKENKNLNIKVASLGGEIKGLDYTIEKLREELSAYDREYFDEDKKANNIYKSQKENILMGKI